MEEYKVNCDHDLSDSIEVNISPLHDKPAILLHLTEADNESQVFLTPEKARLFAEAILNIVAVLEDENRYPKIQAAQ